MTPLALPMQMHVVVVEIHTHTGVADGVEDALQRESNELVVGAVCHARTVELLWHTIEFKSVVHPQPSSNA